MPRDTLTSEHKAALWSDGEHCFDGTCWCHGGDPALQFDNPNAPAYDWRRDREWLNQRLATANIRNSHLHNRLVAMRQALKAIKSPKATTALAADDAAKILENTC